MNQLLTLFRKDTGSQAMRQSAALTTVYLLELNRKFEAFMREQVDRLEGRVSAQQARQAGRAVSAETWEDHVPTEIETWPDEVQIDEVDPIERAASFVETDEMEEPDLNQTGVATRSAAAPIEADIPDFTALLIGDIAADEVQSETVADQEVGARDEFVDATLSANSEATGLWAGDQPERAGAGLEGVEDNTEPHLVEETAAESRSEPIAPVETSGSARPQHEGDWPGAEKLVLLTGDPRPDAAGIPASELLSDEPEAMMSWSPEADLSEAARDQKAGLGEETTKAAPTNRAEATASEGEALEMADEPADWDTVLPAAGQKRNWA
jgi:hypothetical protein